MKIIGVNSQTDPLWQTLVEKPNSSVFHSPRWVQVLNETYRLEVLAYVGLDDAGIPQAGIPFCRICDIRGDRIVPL
jgi:hypothetical protein